MELFFTVSNCCSISSVFQQSADVDVLVEIHSMTFTSHAMHCGKKRSLNENLTQFEITPDMDI